MVLILWSLFCLKKKDEEKNNVRVRCIGGLREEKPSIYRNRLK